jgi:hypothetical protein
MRDDLRDARDALRFIDPGCSRDDWHRFGRAAIAAGLSVDDVVEWSAAAPNFKGERDVRAAFRTVKPDGGTGPATLFKAARDAGWKPAHQSDARAIQRPAQPRTDTVRHKPDTARRGPSAAELWQRFEPATAAHGYITSKDGTAEGLRVVPAADPLTVAGVPMAGALVVPVVPLAGGEPVSLQFIAPPDLAAQWKAAGKPSKLNLSGAPVAGVFTVGEVLPGGVVHVVEGIGQAWACWKATGCAAVVAFGWGRVRAVAAELRQRDASARLVVVPDAGKEADAAAIAQEVGAQWVGMPAGSVKNFDANDYAQAHGVDALEVLLSSASEPPKPEPRFKLWNSSELRSLPPQSWRVRGVLPSHGVCAVFGASGSGKSFLTLDMAAAIAEGGAWFGYRVKPAPVAYAVLEGEGGFRLRVAAWEQANARPLPDALRLVLQGFKLTEAQDVRDLAAAVLALGAGAVTIVDTLNRAAPGADENSSQDMGAIIEGAKELQRLTAGLVVLVHHSGKDAARGMRGHSSLIAALDAAIEVTRTDDRREWKVTKAKDGEDGNAHAFRLEVVELGEDEDGEGVTSCVVKEDATPEGATRSRVPKGGNQRIAYDALCELLKKSHTFGRAGAPAYRPCVELEPSVEAIAPRLMCEPVRKKERTRQALTGLVATGVLCCREGWLWMA